MPDDEAFCIHDGQTIIECNHAFCELFLCDCVGILDLRMDQIISGEDWRALALWRGKHIMNSPENKEFIQQYPFLRCDGTTFWGEARSKRIDSSRYRTSIKWLYDD